MTVTELRWSSLIPLIWCNKHWMQCYLDGKYSKSHVQPWVIPVNLNDAMSTLPELSSFTYFYLQLFEKRLWILFATEGYSWDNVYVSGSQKPQSESFKACPAYHSDVVFFDCSCMVYNPMVLIVKVYSVTFMVCILQILQHQSLLNLI